MAVRKVLLPILKFAFSLWLTTSFVFIMARLLPAADAPKGMSETDSVVYGATDATTQENVKADYLKRAGLDKPLFYFGIKLNGTHLADGIGSGRINEPWVSKAVLWHGEKEAREFDRNWKTWVSQAGEKEVKLALGLLLTWSSLDNPADRKVLEKEISQTLQASTAHTSGQTHISWQNLVTQTAPIHYYFPVVQWQGMDNIYQTWMKTLLQGDLGTSTQDYEAVSTKIKEAASTSIALAFLGLLLALLVSFFAGLHFTANPLSVFTYLSRQFLYFLDSIPAFLIALSLLGIFLLMGGSVLGPLPLEVDNNFWGSLTSPSILLGSLCVALLVIPHLTLQFHRSLVAQTSALYQRTALAKGLTFQKTLKKHLLPNALLPSITILSEVIIGLVAGILVVEITFSLPGIGSLLANSILKADYPVLVGLTLLLLAFRLLVVWLTDFVYGQVDHKMRRN